MGQRGTITCARCDRTRPHGGRGLCDPCWYAAKHDDTLYDHPRSTWPTDDLVETANIIRARHGYFWYEIAQHLGVSYKTLDQARCRARRRIREQRRPPDTCLVHG